MKRAALRMCGLVFVCAATLVMAVPSFADEPMSVGWSLSKDSTKGGKFTLGSRPKGDHQALVNLFASNPDLKKSLLLVVFPGCEEDPKTAGKPLSNLNEIIQNKNSAVPKYVSDWRAPEPRWRICPAQNAVLIRSGRRVPLQLFVDFLREADTKLSPRLHGKVYEISAAMLRDSRTNSDGKASRQSKEELDAGHLAALVSGEQPLGSIAIDLYYELNFKSLRWLASSYARLFGTGDRPSQEDVSKSTGNYADVVSIMPVNVESFRRTMRIPADTEDDKGALLRRTLSLVGQYGSGMAGQQQCVNDDEFGYQTRERSAAYNISGTFSTKWSIDHSLHPGFGFLVEAWTNEGGWHELTSDWVQSDGTWSLTIPSSAGFTGSLLRVLYRSYNSYYKPQNQAGNTYSWKDPDWLSIGTTFSTGHRYADTDGGDYNGVGELVDAAMYMWSRLYWLGGINPVPSSPLDVFFPNTWENCGGASPWSCANTSGDIWLIADHGRQADVVVHEFSHQLNNKYWDNKRPAGSGGAHSLSTCYPAKLGMALREGFADFMPAWVGYPARNLADGGFGSGRWAMDLDPEQRVSPPNCANGWENEVWVARCFWDLHDTHTDGDDILWFIHPGAVPVLYLGNGIANDGDARDMRDYENTYRNSATPGHEDFISDIFNQNRM